jgi:hypothetical protein
MASVIGCAVCRFLARRFLNNTNFGHVRAFSNATFCALLLSAIVLLIPPTYTTRARLWIPTSPDPAQDTPPNSSDVSARHDITRLATTRGLSFATDLGGIQRCHHLPISGPSLSLPGHLGVECHPIHASRDGTIDISV